MSLQDHYDWVVLGNHPGALLSACLVARMGFSVLILPYSSHLLLSVSKSGQYFDPEANYLLGLGHFSQTPGLISTCLTKMEMTPQEAGWIRDQDIFPYVITPQVRLMLGAHDQIDSEFQREFGKPFTQVLGLAQILKKTEGEYLSYWNTLPQRLTSSAHGRSPEKTPATLDALRKHLVRVLSAEDASRAKWIGSKRAMSHLWSYESARQSDFLEACEGLWYFVTGNLLSEPTFFQMMHVLSLSRSAGTFQGGMTAYRNFLLSLAKRLGAHIIPKMECRRLFVEHGKLSGIQIALRGNMISTGGGVVSHSLAKIYDRVTYTGRSWFPKKRKSLTALGWKFTVALTVHKEAIPYPLPPRLIWQEKGAPVLEIEQVDPFEYGLKKSEHQILYLRTHMPYTQESLRSDYQRLVAGRMLRQAVEIFPFLDFHVVQVFPDFRVDHCSRASFELLHADGTREDQKMNELATVYHYEHLEDLPENLLIFGGQGLSAQTGIEGLFLVSDQSYPEIGSLGSSVAALEASAWRAHKSGLMGPFKV